MTRASSPAEIESFMHDLQRADHSWRVEVCKGMMLPDLDVLEDMTIHGLGEKVDNNALKLMPNDIQGERKKPVAIHADGNCLLHCASLAAYASQDFHTEMRVRVAMELIIHEGKYLDAEFLSRGLENQRATPHEWAQYSRDYIPPPTGQKIGPAECRQIFRKELASILKDTIFCGIWQVSAIASVLNAKVYLVYPEKGSPMIRSEFNRVFLPREELPSTSSTIFIICASHYWHSLVITLVGNSIFFKRSEEVLPTPLVLNKETFRRLFFFLGAENLNISIIMWTLNKMHFLQNHKIKTFICIGV